ncbi:hypothetical protein DTO013E5_1147 [Penicillium roqueforti]|uniref:Genomic scaffold, ProqFM164S01 n=1 Tax=Penicillium roqueforti (strain FM164) TaxID=1365484 RepID=W6Q2E7_PENRF|nr:uncharacterized protein LCP9604111_1826 [Penicillium roqueforti]CDM28374.1 unnamed protein product [Penicillium roqueforti FM164]KAF9251830.1 hypothetical protein LCP9604111_1826 [Penicillium roqueforti]KAI1836357.1 hypothetical protein CBS147337_2584 [Penicillium roqueforti]KAI2685506.1 hypothetical protein LCP963914a_4833 [Penicillium roqueforti]KAI2690122.1 hypothetical protein CBS147355_573 [Penicillium roqueforti]
MRIIDPQTAVLTNVEVLAYLTSNPPRRPPPNSGNWAPSPDLRDHNTVVKEIHNYASRLSPHLLRYPRYTPRPSSSQSKTQSQAAMTGTLRTSNSANPEADTNSMPPPIPSAEITPMDTALRELVARLQPYGLTKAEVVMILNLGVGLSGNPATEEAREEGANGEESMEVDGEGEGEAEEDDYTAVVLMDGVIEERELRLSDEDVKAILAIIKETLTADYENVKG